MEAINRKISVVMAVYNGELYLKEAIDSILSQTFSDFEFIIINDGSTDATAEIILSYTDSRIVYIDNKVNKKLIYSLNKGLSESKGKYIARMDADDIALPERLQMQYDFMETHPEVGICGTLMEVFFENTDEKMVIKFPENDRMIRAYTYLQAPFCHPTVMMRRDTLEKNDLKYPEEYIHTEDYAMWIEILKYTSAYNIQSVLLRYRRHEESVTAITKKTNMQNRRASLIQGVYFQENGILLSADDLFPFSCFVNRSIPYPLTLENQLMFDRILSSFLSQFSEKQSDLFPVVKEYISKACFYRFLKSRKFPATPCLRKLYFQGGFIYVKKIILLKNKNV